MSSTGILTRKTMTPTTKTGEGQRGLESGLSAYPGLHEGVRQTFATVREVHAKKPLIKAYDDQGVNVAHNNWIPLNHSPGEIVARFGQVRRGMRVLIQYVGPDGAGANATIVGDEQQKNADVPLLPNEAQQGAYRIFAPGSGIG